MFFSKNTYSIMFGCLSWMIGIIIGSLWETAGIWCIVLLVLILSVWKLPKWWISLLGIACLIAGW